MKRNAFTLIELLAVIVILAIIALIAVPIVINIINDAKKSSEERSIDLYVDSVEKNITQENLKSKYNPTTCEIQKNGKIKCNVSIDNNINDDILNIEVKGQMPTGGTIILENGKITDIFDLVLNGKKYNYDIIGKTKVLEIPKAPGLYDGNYKLLASWDELEELGLDVSISRAYPGHNESSTLNTILNNNDKLKTGKMLVISSNVTSISGWTFHDCTNLTSIIIPSSVTRIEQLAFRGCTGLKSITIPNSVTSIGGSVFSNCSSLSSIKVVPNNTVYEDRGSNAIIEKETNKLIAGCKNTIIPNGVTSIGDYAFRGCTGLKNITIPNSVTSIGDYAFSGCTGLTSITIPSSVTSIGREAFSGCTGLTNITIPSSVTSIGDYAFSGCTGLRSITIPSSVTSIGQSAFEGCTGLRSITIPSSVTSIGIKAFEGCTGLTSITIPSSVINIGMNAFYKCTNLESIKVELGNTIYEDRGSNAIIKKSTNELIVGCKNTTIPSSVTSIGSYAFQGCTGLTSITIPSSVTSIGREAFYGCTGLTNIKVESGNITYEDRGANAIIEKETNTLIVGCKNTTIPNSVTNIGNSAFGGSVNLTSITIPDSVTSIGQWAFSGCKNLESVIFENTSGWFTTSSSSSTSGTSIDVTNSSTNAEKIKDGTYTYYYWKRNI